MAMPLPPPPPPPPAPVVDDDGARGGNGRADGGNWWAQMNAPGLRSSSLSKTQIFRKLVPDTWECKLLIRVQISK